MTLYEFTAVISGTLNDLNLNQLYDAGCSDATFGTCAGQIVAWFCREADKRQDAIDSATQQINSVPGLRLGFILDGHHNFIND